MTATAVAMRDGYEIGASSGTLAIRPGQEMWTDKQRAALAVLGIRDATNADLAVFMHYCQKTGLDPFSRQIYMIMRREKQGDQWVAKQTIQVGIDGFRVIRDRIAARTGATIEYEDTIWYDADGREHAVWLSDEPPAACRVTVLKNGRRFPAVVRTASYMATNKDTGKPVSQWRTQADHMIEKCAEAFALRRAFPHDLGGVYLEDEMPPVQEAPARPQRVTAAEVISRGEPEPEPPAGGQEKAAEPKLPKPATEAALKRMNDIIGQLDLGPDEDIAALIHWITGTDGTGIFTTAHADNVTSLLRDALKAAGGDTDKAAAEIWAQYRRMNPQAGEDSA
jgi:phage recombination protein Bet